MFRFNCNVCNENVTTYAFLDIERETGICPTCGAPSRLRAMTHLLSRTLYGTSTPAAAWPARDALVYGVSDWAGFAPYYGHAVHYINTQFDRELYPDAPFLDVTSPPDEMLATADAITCSDILEHVAPPVQRAFDGLFALLKPGGTLILTVPFNLDATVEHFPGLYEWRLQERDGKRILINRTRDGMLEAFDDLIFHGGGAAVIEMRIFGLHDLKANLAQAGFVDIEVMDEDHPEFGIRIGHVWSRPIIARRPG